ncbi:MAG: hypothetical protein JWO20_319 [Candidatus Angelobacter sp.]|jgi:hypothetical protein|nr:hypothetical protein [Candidatus Angelobacter sp.]
MRLLDRIKSVEQKAHTGWNDIEARIRHRWRVYPNRKNAAPTAQIDDFTSAVDVSDEELRPVNPGDLLEMMARAELSPQSKSTSNLPEKSPAHDDERKPIVSINGKDVDEKELEKGEKKKDASAA